jgi:biopolymer transport protein ExbB
MKPILGNIALEFFINGGPVMWPIVLCLVTAIAVILERFLWWMTLSKRSSITELENVYNHISSGRFEAALNASERNSENPFLAIVIEGLKHAHSSLLGAMQLKASTEIEEAEKRLWILNSFITLAPLLGLLGTVAGIMHSFHFVGNEELAVTKVSGGIAEALIATSCGLGIAILSLLPYNYFNRRLSQFRARLERTINHVELLVESAKHHGFDLEAFSSQRARACFQKTIPDVVAEDLPSPVPELQSFNR